jgi:hypothetical protein
MNFDYAQKIDSLTLEQRLSFYELLAFNLTISVRSIGANDEITNAEKIDRLKWVNEILHRVTAKILYLRRHQNTWSETDSWESIKHWVGQNPAIGGDIGWAIQTSYDCVQTQDNENPL